MPKGDKTNKDNGHLGYNIFENSGGITSLGALRRTFYKELPEILVGGKYYRDVEWTVRAKQRKSS